MKHVKLHIGLVAFLFYAISISSLVAAVSGQLASNETKEEGFGKALFGKAFDELSKLRTVPIDGAPQDQQAALLWCFKLANNGNAAAQNNLAVKYATGDGVRKNVEAALRWFKMAASQNLATAEFNLVILYGGEFGLPKDNNEFMKWLRKAADHGVGYAECAIGMFYLEGIPGIKGMPEFPKDEIQGMIWLHKAAEQGVPLAEFAIGVGYLKKENATAEERSEAIKWIKRASDHGLSFATIILAEIYEKGNGVPKNFAEALKLIKGLADHGDPLGQMLVAEAYEKGLEGVTKDDAEAFRHYLMAANQGYYDAYSKVGEAYAVGRGVEKNEELV